MKRRAARDGVIRWGLPLLLTAGTVYAVYLAFLHIDFTRADDGWILASMGAAYLIAAAFVIGFTRRWELRSLGQVVTYLADAGLYLGIGLGGLGYRHPLSIDDQDAIRAGFVVGGSFLVIGLLWWAVRGARMRPVAPILDEPTPTGEPA